MFDATVNAVYQGDAREGEAIQIKQLGGTSEGTRYTVEGVAPLVEGDTVLVFLSTYPDSPASILGGDAGAFTLHSDTFVSIGNDRLTVTPAELSSF